MPADDPTATEVDLFRGTGNTINTAPIDELLMLDGREDNLEDQALGAVHAHYDNTEEPDANDLERLAQFQHTRQFFSSDELYEFANNGGAAPRLLAVRTRQIEPLPSSLTSREPSFSTPTPTGRPQTLFASTTNPVRKSS